ncbi:hypothetical protein FAIPA1_10205 [Frankia sp. AiPs1]|nr:SDR family NAD(P)-dependent oxidoreductase [Frankia sp. AiPa1]
MLVNNAGILPEATDIVEHEFADTNIFRQTFETNTFGPVTVTEIFLPLLRESAPVGSSTSRRPWARSPTRTTLFRRTTRCSCRRTEARRPH